jgi:hypothetical protein
MKQAMIAPGLDELGPGEESGFGLGRPEAEMAFLIDIHPDVILEFCESLEGTKVKAVIVPIERPGIGPGFVRQLGDLLTELGIELAAPKPSCSLAPSTDAPQVSEFIKTYDIGRPVVDLHAKVTGSGDLTIAKAKVLRSSPCGATWYICRRLVGTEVEPEKIAEVVSGAHHAYPCTASMARDSETGDTYLHEAGRIAREAVFEGLIRNLDAQGLADEAADLKRGLDSL